MTKTGDVAALEEAFMAAQEECAKQGDIVRSLKADHKEGKVTRVSSNLEAIQEEHDGLTYSIQLFCIG